jgi:hypothetical protein
MVIEKAVPDGQIRLLAGEDALHCGLFGTTATCWPVLPPLVRSPSVSLAFAVEVVHLHGQNHHRSTTGSTQTSKRDQRASGPENCLWLRWSD